MKLKKKMKKIWYSILLILLVVGGIFAYNYLFNPNEVKEAKVVSEIKKYGYKLKDNKTTEYKKMFEELKEILEADEVDEEKYVKKISEMFIYDFYSLKDKSSKTDIGGVDFVEESVLPNFLENAQDTYYKYVENNIYKNRRQNLPVVTDIKIEEVKKDSFKYGKKTDDEAYIVKASWDYTDSNFSDYQKSGELVFVHDDIKLVLVELQ